MAAALIEVRPLTLMQGSEEEDDAGRRNQLYHVRLTEKPADFAAVWTLAAAFIPAKGSTDASGRYCKKRYVSRFPNAALTDFIVTCEFEYQQWEAKDPNPLDRKDEISFDIDAETEAYFTDNSTPPKRVITATGERFERLPERTTGGVKLVIEGNRATFNAAQAVTYTRPSSTNSDSFTVRGITVAAGQAKLTSMSAKPVTEGTYTYWRHRWELPLAPDWLQKFEHVGYLEMVDGVPWPIQRGTPPELITTPWPLNADGTAKASVTDTPDVLEFKPYPARPYSVFAWTAAA
ncbi:MAG: hypothetical protein QM754_00725 [Tepidisphaeraceae bacterium]